MGDKQPKNLEELFETYKVEEITNYLRTFENDSAKYAILEQMMRSGLISGKQARTLIGLVE